MGGVGKDAHAGRGLGTDRLILRVSGRNLSLYLWLRKEGWIVGKPGNRDDGISEVDAASISKMKQMRAQSLSLLDSC